MSTEGFKEALEKYDLDDDVEIECIEYFFKVGRDYQRESDERIALDSASHSMASINASQVIAELIRENK